MVRWWFVWFCDLHHAELPTEKFLSKAPDWLKKRKNKNKQTDKQTEKKKKQRWIVGKEKHLKFAARSGFVL